jgi:enterochelin esterase-like enzyme
MNFSRSLFSLWVCVSASAWAQPSGPLISPDIHPNQSVTFRLRAPKAQAVECRGQWDRQSVAMVNEGGLWSLTVPKVEAGVWEYSFVVDGLTLIDPVNPEQKPQRNPTASILHVPGTPPKVWDFQDVPHGTVHQHEFHSASLGRRRSAWVYTPPGYETSGEVKYPLLVLQHGSGDRHETWVKHGKANWILDNLIASGKAKPMVVLMIDGHPLGQVPREAADKRAESLKAFENELIKDALPLVERLYRVSAKRDDRAIAGLSMGGWQSLSIGMNHLDLFAWIGSFSGAVDEKEIQKPLENAAETNAKLKLLWIACGEKDFLLERNEQIVSTLKAKGVKHDWLLTPGDHSWPDVA